MGGSSSRDSSVPKAAKSSDVLHASDIRFEYEPLEEDEVGIVYIVTNNYRYDENMALRDHGVDLKKMKSFFTGLVDKYYVVPAQNRTRENFISTCKYLAEWSKYPATCKRIIIYFAGHGSNGHITMEADVKDSTNRNVTINEILSLFRTEACKHMLKLFLFDACCNAHSVVCEEGSNELVACAASEGYSAQSDPYVGGYWTNELSLMLDENQGSDILTVLENVKRKMENKKYPLYDQTGKFVACTNLSPSFKSGLLETEKVYFPKKGAFMYVHT